MELFDYMKLLFEPGGWDKVKKIDKSKNHFMLHRFMSIQFPIQANEINRIGVNPYSAADFWKHFLGRIFKFTPKWMYTKTKKEGKKDKIWEPSDEALNYWYDLHDFAKKDYIQFKEFFPLELKTELEDIEKFLKKNK